MDKELPGSRCWLLAKRNHLSCFVVLLASPKADRFTLEVAWSRDGQLPRLTTGEVQRTPEANECRFRLSRLWQPYGFETWYDLQCDADHPDSGAYDPAAPDAPSLARIPSKVARALDAFERFAVPYVRETLGLDLLRH
jgi:hypothetical protein